MAEISQKTVVRLSPQEGCWVKYLLNLDKIRYRAVAELAGCTPQSVSHFLSGFKSSARIPDALCKALGFGSLNEMLNEQFSRARRAA